ncbi:MAG TPA: aspartate aminotransferase family protein [Bacillales bacterium]
MKLLEKFKEDTGTFDRLFLNSSDTSQLAYEQAVTTAKNAVINGFANQSQPYSGLHPEMLAGMIEKLPICPEKGNDLEAVLNNVSDTFLEHSMVVSDPSCLAHLHCPVVIPALAAEMLISATNQSMDSWDQSPAATQLEVQMVKWLCSLFGYSGEADGVFTSGGTQSNYMGLLLARDSFCKTQLRWNVQRDGLPPEAKQFRILCSKHAHFTVQQSAAQLGLGQEAVVPVETDENQRMSVDDLKHKVRELHCQSFLPFAIVATAGTTDFGSIDPLIDLANMAEQYQMWLHVDAAYGGALALSDIHHRKINGVQFADSLTVDFHKLFYQPISCGAFLLKDARHFELMRLNADYLNPEEDEVDGVVNLVAKSTQTTRRFDALKLFISLQTLGRREIAAMIDHTIDLAQQTADLISSFKNLERLNVPEINAVVFRYCPAVAAEKSNAINRLIQRSFLYRGKAVFAKTKIDGTLYLKFTLLNPRTTLETIEQILTDIQILGEKIEDQERGETCGGK